MSFHLGGPVGVPVPVAASPPKATMKMRTAGVSRVPVAPRGRPASIVLKPIAGGPGRGIRHRGGSVAAVPNPGLGGESKQEYSDAPIEGETWEVTTKSVEVKIKAAARPASSAPGASGAPDFGDDPLVEGPELQTAAERAAAELTAKQTEIKQQPIVIMKGDPTRKGIEPKKFHELFASKMKELQQEMRRQYAIVYFGVDPGSDPSNVNPEYLEVEELILADWRRRIDEGDVELQEALLERKTYYNRFRPDDHVPLLDYEGARMLPGYGLLQGITGVDAVRIRRPRNQFGKWFRVFLQARFEEIDPETNQPRVDPLTKKKLQGKQVAQPGMAQERKEEAMKAKGKEGVEGFETRDAKNPRILPDPNLIAAYNKGAAYTAADTPKDTLKLVEMIMERYQRVNIVAELFNLDLIEQVRQQRVSQMVEIEIRQLEQAELQREKRRLDELKAHHALQEAAQKMEVEALRREAGEKAHDADVKKTAELKQARAKVDPAEQKAKKAAALEEAVQKALDAMIKKLETAEATAQRKAEAAEAKVARKAAATAERKAAAAETAAEKKAGAAEARELAREAKEAEAEREKLEKAKAREEARVQAAADAKAKAEKRARQVKQAAYRTAVDRFQARERHHAIEDAAAYTKRDLVNARASELRYRFLQLTKEVEEVEDLYADMDYEEEQVHNARQADYDVLDQEYQAADYNDQLYMGRPYDFRSMVRLYDNSTRFRNEDGVLEDRITEKRGDRVPDWLPALSGISRAVRKGWYQAAPDGTDELVEDAMDDSMDDESKKATKRTADGRRRVRRLEKIQWEKANTVDTVEDAVVAAVRAAMETHAAAYNKGDAVNLRNYTLDGQYVEETAAENADIKFDWGDIYGVNDDVPNLTGERDTNGSLIFPKGLPDELPEDYTELTTDWLNERAVVDERLEKDEEEDEETKAKKLAAKEARAANRAAKKAAKDAAAGQDGAAQPVADLDDDDDGGDGLPESRASTESAKKAKKDPYDYNFKNFDGDDFWVDDDVSSVGYDSDGNPTEGGIVAFQNQEDYLNGLMADPLPGDLGWWDPNFVEPATEGSLEAALPDYRRKLEWDNPTRGKEWFEGHLEVYLKEFNAARQKDKTANLDPPETRNRVAMLRARGIPFEADRWRKLGITRAAYKAWMETGNDTRADLEDAWRKEGALIRHSTKARRWAKDSLVLQGAHIPEKSVKKWLEEGTTDGMANSRYVSKQMRDRDDFKASSFYNSESRLYKSSWDALARRIMIEQQDTANLEGAALVGGVLDFKRDIDEAAREVITLAQKEEDERLREEEDRELGEEASPTAGLDDQEKAEWEAGRDPERWEPKRESYPGGPIIFVQEGPAKGRARPRYGYTNEGDEYENDLDEQFDNTILRDPWDYALTYTRKYSVVRADGERRIAEREVAEGKRPAPEEPAYVPRGAYVDLFQGYSDSSNSDDDKPAASSKRGRDSETAGVDDDADAHGDADMDGGGGSSPDPKGARIEAALVLEDKRQAELAKRLARLSGLGGGERWNNALPWYRK